MRHAILSPPPPQSAKTQFRLGFCIFLSLFYAKGERCTKMLVKSGADANLAMANGQTAVHVAAAGGNLAVLRVLLQNGGDAQIGDKVQAEQICNIYIL